MKIDQPNFTQVPNVLIDNMERLSCVQFKLAMAVCRHTFGWHRDKAELSISTLVAMTGLSRPSVIDGLEELVRMGVMARETSNEPYAYSLVVNEFDSGKPALPAVVNGVYQPGKPLLPEVERSNIKVNKDLKKRTKKEVESLQYQIPKALDVPEFKEVFEQYIQHRTEIRKPITSRGAKMALAQCEAWGLAGAIQSIQASIAAGWQGLFEPKRSPNAPQTAQERRAAQAAREFPEPTLKSKILVL